MNNSSLISRRAIQFALLGFIPLSIIYFEFMLGAGAARGFDFDIFFAAAGVANNHGNPYDLLQLKGSERLLLPFLSPREQLSLGRWPFPQSPLLLLALRPLVALGSQTAYVVWTICSLILIGTAIAVSQRLYAPSQSLWMIIVSVCAPVIFLTIFLGQPDALILVTTPTVIWLQRKRAFSGSGVIVCMTLIKPQIGLGIVIVLGISALLHNSFGRYMAGVAIGLIITLLGCLAAVGLTGLVQWVGVLMGFGKSTMAIAPDIASAATLYVAWASPPLILLLESMGFIVWFVLVWRSRPRVGRDQNQELWLWLGITGWMIATPYAHSHDDIVLIPAIWALLSLWRAHQTAVWLQRLFWISWFTCPLAFLLGIEKAIPLPIRGVGIIPIALLTILLWHVYLQTNDSALDTPSLST